MENVLKSRFLNDNIKWASNRKWEIAYRAPLSTLASVSLPAHWNITVFTSIVVNVKPLA